MGNVDVPLLFFFFSSRRRHTRYIGDWSSDVCSSDLRGAALGAPRIPRFWRGPATLRPPPKEIASSIPPRGRRRCPVSSTSTTSSDLGLGQDGVSSSSSFFVPYRSRRAGTRPRAVLRPCPTISRLTQYISHYRLYNTCELYNSA